MKIEQIGGLIVIVGCLLLLLAAWWAFGITGLLVALGVALIVCGVGVVLVEQDRVRKQKFEEAKARVRARFEQEASK